MESIMREFLEDVIGAMEKLDKDTQKMIEKIKFWGIAREELQSVVEQKKPSAFKYEQHKLSSQYKDVVYWAKLSLSNDAADKLNNQYRDVTCIHIMPYSITKDTVDKAEQTDNFSDKINANPDFCDFDSKSGNFHKKPDGNYQVVLAIGGGPLWNSGISINQNESLEAKKSKIKNNYYFPRIFSDNEELPNQTNSSDYILRLLTQAMTEIGLL